MAIGRTQLACQAGQKVGGGGGRGCKGGKPSCLPFGLAGSLHASIAVEYRKLERQYRTW
jgi:hypothetical protein